MTKLGILKNGAWIWFYGPRFSDVPSDDLAYPYLDSISDLQDVARATGHGGVTDAQVSSMNAVLDNERQQVYNLIGLALKCRAVVFLNDIEVFRGMVATVELGLAITLGIESPEAQDLPMVKTSILGDYSDDAAIPWVYGDLSQSPVKPVHLRDNVYIAAAWPCESVVGAQIDGQETSGFNAYIITDDKNNGYQAVELAAPAPQGTTVTVTLRGKVSKRTGALMTNPAEIIEDLYSSIGQQITLASFYNECNNAGLVVAGTISEQKTARAAINEICESVGAIWSRNTVRLYPAPVPIEASETFKRFDKFNISNLKAQWSDDRCFGGVRVEYDQRQDTKEFGKYLQLQAQPTDFDSRLIKSAPWLRSSQNAITVGAAQMERTAGETVSISFESDTMDVFPTDWALIDHPLLPVSDYFVVFSINKSLTKNRATITGELILRKPDVLTVLNSSQQIAVKQTQGIEVERRGRFIVFTVFDESRKPFTGVEAYLDNIGPRTSDSKGEVVFEYVAGDHILGLHIIGYVDQEITVTL